MNPVHRLAAWLYVRPRLRRAWRLCCALWLGAAWAVAAAPTSAADPYQPTTPSVAGGQPMMAWTGLHDTYGVPVSDYFISTVSPIQAGTYAFDQQSCGFSHLEGCLQGGISGFAAALSNILASGILAVECAILIFVGAAGIWLLKFALSAPWLSWLATLANPFVNTLNAMTDQLYVIPIALLVSCLVGGVIALTKGMGRGLGIIAGGFLVILLIYVLLRQPVQDMLGPNGVLSIGQYLGFMVAEGAVHNGPLATGGSGASLDALTSLLCDALLREPVQMINFNTVVDNIPACGYTWSAAIMTGQISAPAQAMASCGDPAALTYADQLGLGTAGWCLVVLIVEFVVMLALVYIAFHVIIIGFKAFFNVLVIVVAAPLAVAPGPTRRFGRRSAHKLIIDGVEMLATTAGLGVVTIIQAEVTSGSVPGLTGMSSPVAKLMMMLLLAVAGAFAYHHMLVSFRQGLGGRHRWFSSLGEFGKNVQYIDYLQVTATGRSLSGWRRNRWYHDPKTSDLWPGPNSNLDPDDDQEKGPQPVYIVPDPGRSGHPLPNNGNHNSGRLRRTAHTAAEGAEWALAPEEKLAEKAATTAAGRRAGQTRTGGGRVNLHQRSDGGHVYPGTEAENAFNAATTHQANPGRSTPPAGPDGNAGGPSQQG